MERFQKSPKQTRLPPDLEILLATDTPATYSHPPIEITEDGDDKILSQPRPPCQHTSGVPSGKVPVPPATSSQTPTPPPISFRAVNTPAAKNPPQKKAATNVKSSTVERSLATLAPATARSKQQSAPRQPSEYGGKCLNDLPAELRVEIYKMVLQDVTIHILPMEARLERRAPHPLTRVSKPLRNEVLPIIHANCPIEAMITDFNFSGMLAFMQRIPPEDEKALAMNDRLKIQLCTTGENTKGVQWNVSDSISLGRWLRYRADKCRLQPKWEYCGIWPGSKVESAIRRKISRMTEDGKKQELIKLGTALKMQRLEKPPKTGTEAS